MTFDNFPGFYLMAMLSKHTHWELWFGLVWAFNVGNFAIVSGSGLRLSVL